MTSVVVLNKLHQYHAEVDIKRVCKWIVNGKIDIVKSFEGKVLFTYLDDKGVKVTIYQPLVVRLLEFIGWKPKREGIPLTPHAVFDRDKNICQYWHKDEDGVKFKYLCGFGDRTIDHVIPKSRGGENSYTNWVCSCKHCNEVIKKNRTPKEAGLELIRSPFVPVRKKSEFVIPRFVYNKANAAHNALYEYYGKETA